MNVTVRQFILSNKNSFLKWKIDGVIYDGNHFVPEYVFKKCVFDWSVSQCGRMIELTTEYHT